MSPGFIDVHSHASQGLEGALKDARQLIAQGITTVALNPDGGGTPDLRAQRAGFEQRGVGVNVALYVPHGAIRRDVLGMADRAPTAAELDRMVAMAKNGMEAGGIGLSSGLYYAPGSYAKTEEVIALAKVVGEMGGVYESHIRDEADYNIGVVGAVQEVIRIAEEGHLPGIVAHMKALGPASWGLSMALVERIKQARDRGVEVYADQYPYDASGTGIVGALIPRWAEVGGRAGAAEADPGRGARAARGRHPPQLRAARRPRQAGDLALRAEPGVRGSVAGAGREGDRQAGRRDGDGAAAERRRQPRVVQHDRERHRADHAAAVHDDLHRRRPRPVRPGQAAPARQRRVRAEDPRLRQRTRHDRSAVRDPIDDQPAGGVFGLKDRGTLRPGAWADILIFDPAKVRDAATYLEPHQMSEGMDYVLVNGVIEKDADAFTGKLGGRVVTPDRR